MSKEKKSKLTMEEALASRPSPQAQKKMDNIVVDSLAEETLQNHCKPEEQKILDVPPQSQPMNYVPPTKMPGEGLTLTTSLREPTQTPMEITPEIPIKEIIPVLTENPQPELTQNSSEGSPEPPQEINKEEWEAQHPNGIDEDGRILVAGKLRSILNWRNYPVEVDPDPDLAALLAYIKEDGFVVSTVAMSLLVIMAQPQISPPTSTWSLPSSIDIPTYVYNVLTAPGYIESVWPSLKIMMGLSSANAAWASGVAITMAFFDVCKTLPYLKEAN